MSRAAIQRVFLFAALVFGAVTACSRSQRPLVDKSAANGPAVGGTSGPVIAKPASVGDPSECRRCELGSQNRNCSPAYLTALRDASGNPVPDTFGCRTLATPAGQAACGALLSCINKFHCSLNPITRRAPGDNPVMGCYCGKSEATNCLGGTGIDGPCVAQYHAAATAAPGGPAAGAPESAFAGFIGPRAFDATTAFGLADNIVTCAVDAACSACDGL